MNVPKAEGVMAVAELGILPVDDRVMAMVMEGMVVKHYVSLQMMVLKNSKKKSLTTIHKHLYLTCLLMLMAVIIIMTC